MGLGVGPDAVTAPVPESLAGVPVPVVVLVAFAVTGWLLVLAGLRRGLRGPERGPVLLLHTLTPPGLVAGFSFAGYGTLHALVAATAGWWSLVVVAGRAPERLVRRGTLPRLAAWLGLAAAVTVVASRLVGLS